MQEASRMPGGTYKCKAADNTTQRRMPLEQVRVEDNPSTQYVDEGLA